MSAAAAGEFWTSLPAGRGVTLIKCDPNGLAALSKPAGVLSHPNTPKDQQRSLLDARYDKEGEYFVWASAKGAEQRLWLLNRLDSATSGVVLVASNESLAHEIKEQFAKHAVTKLYNALVFGRPRAASESWRDRIGVERAGSYVRAGAGQVPAQSEIRVLEVSGGKTPIALLELRPLTGRTHQLRVQCAKRHLPIIGDATYGDFRRNRDFAKATGLKRLFLHSVETRLEYSRGGRKVAFQATAPLPEEFGRAMAL
ncbi:MAG TPA: RNA pseudouridine synthase [Opitutaceae bacterium]|nr:RNA pseudouridine synthase [Opitutaceae bacterium]